MPRNSGVLGGERLSIAQKHVLIRKHLTPHTAQARDLGWPHQCRCGQTRWLRRWGRWYCLTCGRWVVRFTHLASHNPICREIGCNC